MDKLPNKNGKSKTRFKDLLHTLDEFKSKDRFT